MSRQVHVRDALAKAGDALYELSCREYTGEADKFTPSSFRLLAALLQSTNDVASQAALTLYNLTNETGSGAEDEIRNSGSITALLKCIDDRPDSQAADNSVRVLRDITSCDLSRESADANRKEIRKANGCDIIAKWIGARAAAKDLVAAADAAGAIWNLAAWDPQNASNLHDAIPALLQVLSSAVSTSSRHLPSDLMTDTVGALATLAMPLDGISMHGNRNLMWQKRAFPLLVKMLGLKELKLKQYAAWALAALLCDRGRVAFYVDIDANVGVCMIDQLLQLLIDHHRLEIDAQGPGHRAGQALTYLMEHNDCNLHPFPTVVARCNELDLTRPPCERLRSELHRHVAATLGVALNADEPQNFDAQRHSTTRLAEAIRQASAVGFGGPELEAARRQLAELIAAAARAADAAKKHRQQELGIANLEPSGDILCPITMEKMVNPVIASDGHTYERDAIQDWISGARAGTVALSPLTREPLAPTLIPNHAMRKRIGEYDEELERIAKAAFAAGKKRPREEAPCPPDGSPSILAHARGRFAGAREEAA